MDLESGSRSRPRSKTYHNVNTSLKEASILKRRDGAINTDRTHSNEEDEVNMKRASVSKP